MAVTAERRRYVATQFTLGQELKRELVERADMESIGIGNYVLRELGLEFSVPVVEGENRNPAMASGEKLFLRVPVRLDQKISLEAKRQRKTRSALVREILAERVQATDA